MHGWQTVLQCLRMGLVCPLQHRRLLGAGRPSQALFHILHNVSAAGRILSKRQAHFAGWIRYTFWQSIVGKYNLFYFAMLYSILVAAVQRDVEVRHWGRACTKANLGTWWRFELCNSTLWKRKPRNIPRKPRVKAFQIFKRFVYDGWLKRFVSCQRGFVTTCNVGVDLNICTTLLKSKSNLTWENCCCGGVPHN